MKKNFALSALFVIAIISGAIFINSVSANKDSDKSSELVSTTIVISQVYGGGGGSTGTYLNDYVELKNISSSPQSLNGLSLYYGSATGQFASSATNAFLLPNVTLNPGQYYLVQLGAVGTGGTAFPVPADVVTTNLSMSAASGKVGLVVTANLAQNTCGATATPCNSTQLAAFVDWLAYGQGGNGPGGTGEGGTSVNNNTAMSSTQGGVRKGNGCTDTDNNNLDFDVVTAPIPRNTASTATSCTAAPSSAPVDFNGDGKTDYALVRNVGGGPTGQIRWFINYTGTATTVASDWGITTDSFVPEDYDGDNKTDIAVWRGIGGGQPSGNGFFYILQSQTNTVRIEDFGQVGDNPRVVGDYNGDGKADVAVYRGGASPGQNSVWYWRTAAGGPINNQIWGLNGDFPAPGDYDGDGKNDFVIQRNNGGGNAIFWRNQTTAGISTTVFGTSTDQIVPGDYDGDGKTDIAIIRGVAGAFHWWHLRSSDGVSVQTVFGSSATDFPTQGDYDGDGKTDQAIWRPSATPGASAFWANGSTSGAFSQAFGSNGDYPVANFNVH